MSQPTKTVSVTATEAKTHFGAIVRRVYTNGEHLIVERDGLPVVVIIPVGEYQQQFKTKKQGGW
ncbi:type II toxin-antitoxin system Phd/YefM family antitoxin [Chloroflexota bacterium]